MAPSVSLQRTLSAITEVTLVALCALSPFMVALLANTNYHGKAFPGHGDVDTIMTTRASGILQRAREQENVYCKEWGWGLNGPLLYEKQIETGCKGALAVSPTCSPAPWTAVQLHSSCNRWTIQQESAEASPQREAMGTEREYCHTNPHPRLSLSPSHTPSSPCPQPSPPVTTPPTWGLKEYQTPRSSGDLLEH
ncbi:unnamed protein product [Pleuronectes platessa]|uniref:Uncharacterized protein n=1 Tax=Pleuronectes platessa TaxID=8262 RepID=A0A9N7UCJ1_PLEPL|nr:unnamed protein product [Pleuronectes platessa]